MIFIWTILVTLNLAHTTGYLSKDMEGYIVQGKDTKIESFPHSVFLAIGCMREEMDNFACGGSIISQNFVLTAAHCFERCEPRKSIVIACLGSTKFSDGITIPYSEFRIHEKYKSRGLHNDIGLVKLRKPMTLNMKAKKVYIARKFPPFKTAEVAGWGLIDEETPIDSDYLKLAVQKIMSRKECLRYFGFLPEHTFCASSLGGYAAEGDSGSALVVNRFIQVGLVSYKDTNVSTSIIVYTNVSAHYDWIITNLGDMSC